MLSTRILSLSYIKTNEHELSSEATTTFHATYICVSVNFHEAKSAIDFLFLPSTARLKLYGKVLIFRAGEKVNGARV